MTFMTLGQFLAQLFGTFEKKVYFCTRVDNQQGEVAHNMNVEE